MADNQTQKTPEIQVTVDELSNRIQETTNELNQLKNGLNNLSLEQKNDKLSDIENAILECSDDLAALEKDGSVSIDKKKLNILKSQIDTLTSSKENLKKQIEKQTDEALSELNKSVTQSENTEQNQKKGEKKGLSGWRNGLNKGQKWGVRIGGALAGLGIFRLGRRIFGEKYDYEKEIPGYKNMKRREKRKARKKLREKKSTERRSNKSVERGEFRERPFGRFVKGTGIFLGVGSGIYYLAHGIYTKNWGLKDLFDWEKGKKLTFNEALKYSEGAIQNQGDDNSFSHGLELNYNEETSEIEAYGEKIKIDKNARKIEGLNVTFKKYENMINTAIVIAFLKKNYSGMCANNSPFDFSGSWRGNINVNTNDGEKIALDGTGKGGKILGISAAGIASIAAAIRGGGLRTGATVLAAGGILGFAGGATYDENNIMHNLMPELDDEHGKKLLSGYLNNIGGWQEKNQTKNDISQSPLQNYMRECVKDIQDTNQDTPSRGGRRKPDLIPNPNDPNKYTIQMYGRNVYVEVSERNFSSINNKSKTTEELDDKYEVKILGISGGNPKINVDLNEGNFGEIRLPLKEGIYMSSLLGYLLDNFAHKGDEYPRFEYGSQTRNSLRSGFGLWGNRKGLFFSDPKLDTYILTEKTFEEKMPTLFKKENRSKFVKFLNDGIKGDTNESIRKK